MSEDRLYIEYMPLSELTRLDENPKDHDIGLLDQLMDQYGFTIPIMIDESSQVMATGHGRLETLEQKRMMGKPPPERVFSQNGEWYVPVIRGVRFEDRDQLIAYAIADNKSTEAGGWIEHLLLESLERIKEGDQVTGFDQEDIADLDLLVNVPSLDELEQKYGKETTETVLATLTIKVHPETIKQYEVLMGELSGETTAEKFRELLNLAERGRYVRPDQ